MTGSWPSHVLVASKLRWPDKPRLAALRESWWARKAVPGAAFLLSTGFSPRPYWGSANCIWNQKPVQLAELSTVAGQEMGANDIIQRTKPTFRNSHCCNLHPFMIFKKYLWPFTWANRCEWNLKSGDWLVSSFKMVMIMLLIYQVGCMMFAWYTVNTGK